MSDLVRGTAAVGRGDLHWRIPVRGNDEFSEVATSFNEMSRRLSEITIAKVDLERIVLNRTTEIGHLLQVEQQANEAKSLFLRTMSHELRTPLNAVIGYSELLREEAGTRGIQNAVPDIERIHAAGLHLLSLINEVLDMSRLESGKLALKNEMLSSSDVIQSVAATITPAIGKRNNKFVVEGGEPTHFTADPLRVRQVLLNLLSNAAKFTENGTVTLKVFRKREGDAELLLWEVSDTGIGIAPEDMDKLFQPFSQIEPGKGRLTEGVGLGLVISRGLCERMGFSLTCASVLGKGSTFTMEIPLQ